MRNGGCGVGGGGFFGCVGRSGGRRLSRPLTPALSPGEREILADEEPITAGNDQRGQQNNNAEREYLRILHFKFLMCGCAAGAKSGLSCWRRSPHPGPLPGGEGENGSESLHAYRDQKQPAHQDAGQVSGQSREEQAVLQDRDREQAQHGPLDRATAAEDRRAPQHDGSDGGQFVAGAGVGFGLADVRDIDHRGQAGGDARQDIDEAEASLDGDAGVASAVVRKADGVKTAADRGPLQQDPKADGDDDEDRELRRNAAGQVALTEKLKAVGNVEADRAAGESFAQAAIERIGAERDDQGRQPEFA